jgi:hypothetical protein
LLGAVGGLFTDTVLCMYAFHSVTTSAFATPALQNTLAATIEALRRLLKSFIGVDLSSDN